MNTYKVLLLFLSITLTISCVNASITDASGPRDSIDVFTGEAFNLRFEANLSDSTSSLASIYFDFPKDSLNFTYFEAYINDKNITQFFNSYISDGEYVITSGNFSPKNGLLEINIWLTPKLSGIFDIDWSYFFTRYHESTYIPLSVDGFGSTIVDVSYSGSPIFPIYLFVYGLPESNSSTLYVNTEPVAVVISGKPLSYNTIQGNIVSVDKFIQINESIRYSCLDEFLTTAQTNIINFNYTKQFKVEIDSNTGSVDIFPKNSDHFYDAGTEIEVYAYTSNDYTWIGWSSMESEAYYLIDNPMSFIVNNPIKLTANWEPVKNLPNITISTSIYPVYLSNSDVIVNVTARNTGSAKGEFELNLVLDEEILETRTLFLDASEQDTISFNLGRLEDGTHKILVNEDEAIIQVQESEVNYIITNLIISPEVPKFGDVITLNFRVQNMGENDIGKIVIVLDEELYEERSLVLETGRQMDVAVLFKGLEPGDHHVKVGEHTILFKVKDVEPSILNQANLIILVSIVNLLILAYDYFDPRK